MDEGSREIFRISVKTDVKISRMDGFLTYGTDEGGCYEQDRCGGIGSIGID